MHALGLPPHLLLKHSLPFSRGMVRGAKRVGVGYRLASTQGNEVQGTSSEKEPMDELQCNLVVALLLGVNPTPLPDVQCEVMVTLS